MFYKENFVDQKFWYINNIVIYIRYSILYYSFSSKNWHFTGFCKISMIFSLYLMAFHAINNFQNRRQIFRKPCSHAREEFCVWVWSTTCLHFPHIKYVHIFISRFVIHYIQCDPVLICLEVFFNQILLVAFFAGLRRFPTLCLNRSACTPQ